MLMEHKGLEIVQLGNSFLKKKAFFVCECNTTIM